MNSRSKSVINTILPTKMLCVRSPVVVVKLTKVLAMSIFLHISLSRYDVPSWPAYPTSPSSKVQPCWERVPARPPSLPLSTSRAMYTEDFLLPSTLIVVPDAMPLRGTWNNTDPCKNDGISAILNGQSVHKSMPTLVVTLVADRPTTKGRSAMRATRSIV